MLDLHYKKYPKEPWQHNLFAVDNKAVEFSYSLMAIFKITYKWDFRKNHTPLLL